jgi:hypothetical protein
MNWEYSLKILRDTSGNIARVTPVKEFKSEANEILASVEVPPAEYASSIPDSGVVEFFSSSKALFQGEISSMLGYDPTLETLNKGVSSSNAGYALGSGLSVVLDIGVALILRLNGGN